MTYEYDFDETTIGDVSIPLTTYEELHEGLVQLRDNLAVWNQRVLDAGATEVPYEREVMDLDRRIEFGADQLGRAPDYVRVQGISKGSAAYLRAGIEYRIRELARDAEARRQDGWPSAAVAVLRQKVDRLGNVASRLDHDFAVPPAPVLWEVLPGDEAEEVMNRMRDEPEAEVWDVFICHASEDKESFVRALATALDAKGVRVWFDEFELHVGSNLSRAIQRGLSSTRFGVVVLSPSFMAKEWPQFELDGLVARQVEERPLILPIWHEIGAEDVRRFSPPLAALVALRSEQGLDAVVEGLLRVIQHQDGQ